MSDAYAVIGHPVTHSLSPQIHAAFAQQTGERLQYARLPAPLDGFRAAVEQFRANGGKGLNVTLPFKPEAYRLATQRSDRAERAQAVNTLKFEGEDIFGDNTDGIGLVRDIEANLGFALVANRVLLLGAGGAARGVVAPLMEKHPVTLVIANRTVEKARELAQQFRRLGSCAAVGYDELTNRQFDLIINATSAGISDALPPLPTGLFAPRCLAYDMMYGKPSPFLNFAQAQGARVADGLGMLVEQAAESFFIWRGVRPDTAPVLRQLRNLA
jgi:shikimate dehydrogenase